MSPVREACASRARLRQRMSGESLRAAAQAARSPKGQARGGARASSGDVGQNRGGGQSLRRASMVRLLTRSTRSIVVGATGVASDGTPLAMARLALLSAACRASWSRASSMGAPCSPDLDSAVTSFAVRTGRAN